MLERYSINFAGFGLSDAADTRESTIKDDEVLIDKFLHIHVNADLPKHVTNLQGRFRKVVGDGTGNPSNDRDLGLGQKRNNGEFEFVVVHYLLDPRATYFLRVADDFDGDIKCLTSSFIKTR